MILEKSMSIKRHSAEMTQIQTPDSSIESPLDLSRIEIDKSWTFGDLTQKQTRYVSHGYYTYPAKFIPQLAKRLIYELTQEEETVVDPFMGSGTTIVEAILAGRRAIGTDINPVAYLVAKVKSTPIQPDVLTRIYDELFVDLENAIGQKSRLFAHPIQPIIPENERIDYWFNQREKEQLGILLGRINAIEEQDSREIFLVAFSQILKSCSVWLQKSIKPTRDLHKKPAEPLSAFLRQARYMLKQNQVLWNLAPLTVRTNLNKYRHLSNQDARNIPVSSQTSSLIVTSPPYVTSYEYADLHQLTALWLNYAKSVSQFRTNFIGTAHSNRTVIDMQSDVANRIVENLKSERKRREVRNYFADMLECFSEMYRVLKPGGKACIVIGNTKFEGVEVANAEVFLEQMTSLGFHTYDVIKREIPSKMLPQTRDPENGRFTSSGNANKVLAYPVEYILILEKQK